jgi:hypothetical protein
MARPLRIEFPGGLFHVTSRRDRREPSYLADADRLQTSRAGLTFCLFQLMQAKDKTPSAPSIRRFAVHQVLKRLDAVPVRCADGVEAFL